MGPLRSSPGALRTLRPPPWRDRAPPRRRAMVGRCAGNLARRQRWQGPLPCPGRRCRRAYDQSGASGGPPRPQPLALRPQAPQHPSPVPEMPPAARPRRASSPDPSHAAQASSDWRSLLGSLPLLVTRMNWRPSAPRNLQLSDRQARSRGGRGLPAATLGGLSPSACSLATVWPIHRLGLQVGDRFLQLSDGRFAT